MHCGQEHRVIHDWFLLLANDTVAVHLAVKHAEPCSPGRVTWTTPLPPIITNPRALRPLSRIRSVSPPVSALQNW